MPDYKSVCINILKENGPLLGSELQKHLIEQMQIKAGNARQIVYRLKEEKALLTTDPVRFTGNQILYFLPKQNIKKKLKLILPDNAKAFDRIYQAFVDQDGFLFWNQFAKISAGVTDSTGSTHKTVKEIYKDLYKLGLVQEIAEFNQTTVIKATEEWVPTLEDSYSKMYKRQSDLAFNRELTDDLLKWLEKMNLAGWNSSHLIGIDDDEMGYNGYQWDAIGYSYLWGLYTTNKPDNLFAPAPEKTGSLIVVESVLTRELKMYDLAGFISRISVQYGRLKRKGGNFKVIPICFVQSIDQETLILARTRGIMVISIADVFGTKILDALKAIREIDPRNINADSLAKVLEIADSSGQDGKFGSLKGYIFNFMVASLFNNYGFKTHIGAKYDDKKGNKCECDVKIIADDDHIILCEAKGYNHDIQVQLGQSEKDPDSVKKFFERTCKIVEDITGKEILPVFITSGEFTPEAKEYLESKNKTKRMQRLLKKYNFPKSVYYDRSTLIELFGNQPAYTEYKRVLQEFFRTQKKPDLGVTKIK